MIKKIKIKNLKSLVDVELDLPNLTLLTGLNNSGKSTFIQAVRMCIKSAHDVSPYLLGHGGFEDLLSKMVSKKEQIKIDMEYLRNTETLIMSEHHVVNASNVPELLYVGADRLGPQLHLPLNTAFDAKPSVGDKGEYAIDFIKKITNSGCVVDQQLEHEITKGNAFEYALRGWMSEIAPNVQFEFILNTKAEIASTEVNSYRPIHVGFGLSYTLPIVAAALGATATIPSHHNISDNSNDILPHKNISRFDNWVKSKKDKGILLIVENPEAHLHPRGQTAMGKLLALVANTGVQVIVETHSEHIMDGIRIAIKEKIIECQKVQFNYFVKDKDDCSIIETPKIDENGKLSCWPDGFFDQALRNKAILARKS